LRERILIIDDKPLEHRLLDQMVHQLGYGPSSPRTLALRPALFLPLPRGLND
jgi:hypothetical protein